MLLARVGTELLKTNSPAEVVSIDDTTGEVFAPGQTVVSVVDPSSLHVIGQIEEDKGLKDVRIGQKALFTVDAFGSQEFDGVVDEISPTSHSSDVVFSISDNRQENSFDVSVRFDVTKYPELKNGMSAKITIFKN
jgi:multidrug resistance efflux pump